MIHVFLVQLATDALPLESTMIAASPVSPSRIMLFASLSAEQRAVKQQMLRWR